MFDNSSLAVDVPLVYLDTVVARAREVSSRCRFFWCLGEASSRDINGDFLLSSPCLLSQYRACSVPPSAPNVSPSIKYLRAGYSRLIQEKLAQLKNNNGFSFLFLGDVEDMEDLAGVAGSAFRAVVDASSEPDVILIKWTGAEQGLESLRAVLLKSSIASLDLGSNVFKLVPIVEPAEAITHMLDLMNMERVASIKMLLHEDSNIELKECGASSVIADATSFSVWWTEVASFLGLIH